MVILQRLVAVIVAEIATLAFFGRLDVRVVGEVETPLLQLDARGPGVFGRHQLLEDPAVTLQDAVDVPDVKVDVTVDLVVVRVPAEIGTKFFIHAPADRVSAFMTFSVHK